MCDESNRQVSMNCGGDLGAVSAGTQWGDTGQDQSGADWDRVLSHCLEWLWGPGAGTGRWGGGCPQTGKCAPSSQRPPQSDLSCRVRDATYLTQVITDQALGHSWVASPQTSCSQQDSPQRSLPLPRTWQRAGIQHILAFIGHSQGHTFQE